MKFKYLIIVVALSSLLALYGVSQLVQPVVIPISSVGQYDGQHVTVNGVVTAYRSTLSGTQLITIRDTQNHPASVTLYIEGAVAVEYGDTIQATGVVQQYKGQWEVVVKNPKFINILEKWANRSFPVWQLAENPQIYLDTNVNVTGVVTQTETSSFTLSSPDGTYSLSVSYDVSCPHLFSQGDFVLVNARCIYDAAIMRFSLRAADAGHGIWKTDG